MTMIHLWWLTNFLGKIFQFTPAGILALGLYALEGGFFALMAYLVARIIKSPIGRIWSLAGGWGIVEFLRFLGPLAFPWPTLGYSLLPTPLIQVADLGGVLLASLLILCLAGALAHIAVRKQDWQPLVFFSFIWIVALCYGLTRTTGIGLDQPMRVLRQDFNAFGRAAGSLTPAQQLDVQQKASSTRLPDEILVWSETALSTDNYPPENLPAFPGPGISGLGIRRLPQAANLNTSVAVDEAGRVTSLNSKAKLVPFGEYFPLYREFPQLYAFFERSIGFSFQAFETIKPLIPLKLRGVSYGTYTCYDSVFPWVARQLVLNGAQLLVNPSNDGWYEGWGVRQHFWMGRVRAIEQRRWLVRSVNKGVAGAVNDLGSPVSVISTGKGVQTLSVSPKLLNSLTIYARFGDLPVLMLFICLFLYGLYKDRITVKTAH